MPSIDNLPVEILQEIFSIHCLDNEDTPLRLIRVCRTWYAVTSNTGSLWGNIAFQDREYLELGNKIRCYSLHSLAAAIERTRRSKFELTIALKAFELFPGKEEDRLIIDPFWFSQRCRALRLETAILPQFLDHISDFSALETLEICTYHSPGAAIISPLLASIQRTSKKLWFLRVTVGQSYDPMLRDLFSRVTTLRVDGRSSRLDEIARVAMSVKTLDLAAPSYIAQIAPITCLSPDLDTLVLRSISWCLLAQETASKIRHLELYAPNDRQDAPNLEFPNLTHLTVHDWWGAINGIQATNLETLRLCQFGAHHPMIKRTRGTTLRPKRLELEMTMPQREGRRSIQNIFQDVEDLQIVYIGSNRSLTSDLANPLAGIGRKQPLCPRLRRLAVLSRVSSVKRQKMSEKQLRDVTNALTRKGVLKEVSYGWYEGVWRDIREAHIVWTHLLQ